MFAILVVIGIGLVVVFAFFVDRAVNKISDVAGNFVNSAAAEQHYEDQTGIATNPIGFDEAHPPQLDIWKRPVRAARSRSGMAVASGTVHNNTGQPSAYGITRRLQPGWHRRRFRPSTAWSTSPPGPPRPGGASAEVSGSNPVTCRVTAILRTNNALVVPSTTGVTPRPWQQARLGTGLLPAVTEGPRPGHSPGGAGRPNGLPIADGRTSGVRGR